MRKNTCVVKEEQLGPVVNNQTDAGWFSNFVTQHFDRNHRHSGFLVTLKPAGQNCEKGHACHRVAFEMPSSCEGLCCSCVQLFSAQKRKTPMSKECTVPECFFHKSLVTIKAVDATISGAARLGWQQSSVHLMEHFISIMLHYQMRKISQRKKKEGHWRSLKKKKKWSDWWRLMWINTVGGFLQGCTPFFYLHHSLLFFKEMGIWGICDGMLNVVINHRRFTLGSEQETNHPPSTSSSRCWACQNLWQSRQ